MACPIDHRVWVDGDVDVGVRAAGRRVADGDALTGRGGRKFGFESSAPVFGLTLIGVGLVDVVEIVGGLLCALAIVVILVVRMIVGLSAKGLTDLVAAAVLVALFLAAVEGVVGLVVDLVFGLVFDTNAEVGGHGRSVGQHTVHLNGVLAGFFVVLEISV